MLIFVLLASILSLGPNHKIGVSAESSTPEDLFGIDGTYHAFFEVESDLQTIASSYPNIVKLISIGKTHEGRDIWAVKISDNPQVEEDEPEVYYNGAHHAREWMTVEVSMCLINALVENYTTDAAIKDIVDNRQLWIVPVVNPDGRIYDGGEDPSSYNNWRKNRRDNGDGTRGVDLNRNYGYMWGGAGASDRTFSQVYRGPSAFSEPETAAIENFTKGHDFVFSISYHSSGQMILYPWGYTLNNSEDHELLVSVANEMASRITNTAGSSVSGYTPMKGSELYLTSGTDDDWLYGEMGTYSYTIELYPHWADNDPAVSFPYNGFHPRSDKIIPVCNDNLPAALYLAQIADNPFQAMHHVSLSSNVTEQQINQSETKDFYLEVLNDGNVDDTFALSFSGIPGWLIGVFPGSVTVGKGSSANAVLSISPPLNAEGEYKIYVTAKSMTNASVEDTLTLTVQVPYLNDVGVEALAPFSEGLSYPTGIYGINSTVKNFGKNPQVFDTSLEIFKLGGLEIKTILLEDAEDDLTDWTAVDLDGPFSATLWHMTTKSSYSGSRSWWAGNPSGNMYTNTAVQLLVSPPFSLKEALGANLTFYHKYEIESSYDYGNVDIYNGTSWQTFETFTGNQLLFTGYRVDLKDFVGLDNIRVRFRFSSDTGVVDNGWFVDDINVTAEFLSESLIFGPANITSLLPFQDSQGDLVWNYKFSDVGDYKVVSTTWLSSDANPKNDELSVRMKIYKENEKPQIFHTPVTSALVGEEIPLSAKVTDNMGVEEVRLSYMDTVGVPHNESMIFDAITGNYTRSIPAQTAQGIITYFIWANDTSGNENMTQMYIISVTGDTEPPEILHTPVTSAETGQTITISAKVTDNVAVDKVRINYTDTAGVSHNESMTLTGGLHEYDIPAQILPGTITYFIWANDTSDNENATQTYIIQVAQTTCHVIGDVVDEDGSPVKGASMEVLDGNDVLNDDITDAHGDFEITDLPCGKYELRVTKEGYETLTIYINTNNPNLGTIMLTPIITPVLPNIPTFDPNIPPETPTTTFPWWIFILIVIAIIAAILVLFLILRRKKKPDVLEPPPLPLPPPPPPPYPP